VDRPAAAGRGATLRLDRLFAAERFAIAAVTLCDVNKPPSSSSLGSKRFVWTIGRDRAREGEVGPLRERWADFGGVRGVVMVCTCDLVGLRSWRTGRVSRFSKVVNGVVSVGELGGGFSEHELKESFFCLGKTRDIKGC